jgi:site-specific recombinase XerD
MDTPNPSCRPDQFNISPRCADTPGGVIFACSITDAPGDPLTVREAVARYLTLRVTEGLPENGDTMRHLDKHLRQRLCAAYGDLPIRSIKPDHLRTWTAALRSERSGKPLDPHTRRHHLIDVKTFFKRIYREGWLDRDPSAAVVLPQIEEKDVNLLSVKDAHQFFKTNRDHRAVARVALEAFGGIRYTTAGRLVKADIKFERRGIEMPSGKHKSRKRKFRQGHPPNLWTWLEHAPEECWEVTLRQYRDEKKEMFVMAGLRAMIHKSDADREKTKGLKNVWRHSFASYMLARTKHYAPVAYLMQHTRATTTEVYEGIADEFDAMLYFAITPITAMMSWDEFVAFVKDIPRSNPTSHPRLQ